ncbi:efflux RND transporter periplasmic adaptor subunit [Vibrio diazotrophicus]|uniref:efflux RND transporter periplasmic adaptor subunit n=1 Tax=Vibrio diazotrophicus TaxID=685 RepID=UPI0022AFF32A|nr:efflux RND transporter periplasmic adaptor subunit [Vibrio diazotrophicus]MCZ4370180.1 efflux RND transporter periplasmic adaptor subunit [Vibrio diazotrophicus]
MASYSWIQRLLIVPPLVLGGIVLFVAPSMKAEPPKTEQAGGTKVVRVIKIKPLAIQPSVVGYGYTRPAQEWQAQAEVEGRVIWASDHFKNGAFVTKGESLLKLDDSAYQLAITKLNAELDVSKLKYQTIGVSYSIAEQDYKLQKEEYERSERLAKTGHLSQTEKDKAKRDLLNKQQLLQNLKNEQAITVAEQQVLNAELEIARRDLSHTEVKAPYDIRITATNIDVEEYVNKGQALLQSDGMDSVEVLAQYSIGKMRPLRRASQLQSFDNSLHSDLEATVTLTTGDRLIHWQGVVDRSGGFIDAQTQSQTLIVRIPEPYRQAHPGKRPPLIRDTFVKVTLKAQQLENQLIVPINAIHRGNVYVVKDNQLTIQPVDVDFTQGQIAVVKSGVSEGDMVVVSQLQPALEGMKLKPQPDKTMMQWLSQQAAGGE